MFWKSVYSEHGKLCFMYHIIKKKRDNYSVTLNQNVYSSLTI